MSSGLAALGTFMSPGLAALGTFMSPRLAALGTFTSLELPALGTFMSPGLKVSSILVTNVNTGQYVHTKMKLNDKILAALGT